MASVKETRREMDSGQKPSNGRSQIHSPLTITYPSCNTQNLSHAGILSIRGRIMWYVDK